MATDWPGNLRVNILTLGNLRTEKLERQAVHTICPRTLDPFLYVKLLYKMGQDFLAVQYIIYTYDPL